MLQEQMVAASERRRQLPAEVGAAEAESPGAPPSTALHARLLWAETQSLEAELAECRAAAAQAPNPNPNPNPNPDPDPNPDPTPTPNPTPNPNQVAAARRTQGRRTW